MIWTLMKHLALQCLSEIQKEVKSIDTAAEFRRITHLVPPPEEMDR